MIQHGIQFHDVHIAGFFGGTAEFGVFVVLRTAQAECGTDGRQTEAVRSTAAWHVLHDQDAQSVAVVIPSAAFDLDVLSQHVEAHLFDLCQFIDDRFIIRICHQPVTGIPLVQKTAQEQFFMIQAEALSAFLIGFHSEPAHAEIALDRLILSLDVQCIKERIIRCPGTEVLHFDRICLCTGNAFMDHMQTVGHDDDSLFKRPSHLQIDKSPVIVRCDLEIADGTHGHILQPYGLPDAG